MNFDQWNQTEEAGRAFVAPSLLRKIEMAFEAGQKNAPLVVPGDIARVVALAQEIAESWTPQKQTMLRNSIKSLSRKSVIAIGDALILENTK